MSDTIKAVCDAWEWGVITHHEAMTAVRRLVGGVRPVRHDVSRDKNAQNRIRASLQHLWAAPGKVYANQSFVRNKTGGTNEWGNNNHHQRHSAMEEVLGVDGE